MNLEDCIIIPKFCFAAEKLKSRWKNLRDGFVKCLKKMGEASKSGSSATKIHYCQYFEQLLFLKDSVSNRPSTSNVVLPIHVNESRTSIVETDHNIGAIEASIPEPVPISQPKNSSKLETACKSSTLQPTVKKRKNNEDAKKDERRENIDSLLVKTLARYDEVERKENESNEENSDWLFLRSLVPILQKLPPKKNRLARMDIQKILMNYEFDDTDT